MAAAVAKPKLSRIAELQANAMKKYNTRVGPLDDVADDVRSFSTGNIAIDRATGIGGIPRGRLTELYGLNSSGKTTTALQAAKTLQDIILAGGSVEDEISADDMILVIDAENAIDPKYVRALGINTSHSSFMLAQPDTLEEAASMITDFIETGQVRMLIVDSVAALIPAAALEASIERQAIAEQARILAKFIPKLNKLATRHDTACLMLNHLQEIMNTGGKPGMPPSISTPGGKSLKYYSSLRLEYRIGRPTKGKVTDELNGDQYEIVVASNVTVKVVKNKVAAPFKQAHVRVRFGKGFDNFYTALQILQYHKKVTVGTSGYLYFDRTEEFIHPDMPIGGGTKTQRAYLQGEPKWFAFADTHPEWRQLLIDHASRIVDELGIPDDVIIEEGDAEVDADGEPGDMTSDELDAIIPPVKMIAKEERP